jgi:hypothetical protein
MSKAKAKSKPMKDHYDQGRVLELWQAGKSIREITAAMKPISRIYVHRILTTKFPRRLQCVRRVNTSPLQNRDACALEDFT